MEKELTVLESNHSITSDDSLLSYVTSATVQDANHNQPVFNPMLTTGDGKHDNTMHISYSGSDYLKCRHQHGVLTGTFTSAIYDKSSSARRMAYVLADIVVIGIGTTWDSQIPISTTGSTLLTNGDFSNWTANEPDDWTESNCEADEEVSGQSGSGCKITTSAALGGIYQDITVTAGKWYRLEGYYKNDSGDEFRYATYDNSNSKYIDPDWGYLEASATGWTAFTHLFKAPVGCTSIRLYLLGGSSGDVVYVDELTCKLVDETNSTKWSDVQISTNTWGEIFDVAAAPEVGIRLYYGDASPPTSYVDKMEILSTIVKARYYQVEITITDPTQEIYAYVENYELKFNT